MTSMSPSGSAVGGPGASPGAESGSPTQNIPPKSVAFELCFHDSSQYKARLPMRVQIYPHDNTESIVTTVKNFYGLYAGPTGSKGVSFEDKEGNTLIARYENFQHNMVVYVRVFEELTTDPTIYGHHQYSASRTGAQPYHPNGSFHTQHPAEDGFRQSSRSPRRQSPSTHSSGEKRSDSVGSAGQRRRARSSKSQSATSQADAMSDHGNGYSSDEGAPSTTSGRTREQFGNTDISVENIVEGGRRKRAKFESSELPLFAPPQMPAAISNPSVSPARRADHHRLSFSYGHANPFSNPRPIQATHNYNAGIHHPYAPNMNGHRHSRVNSGVGINGSILPTPDPTVGSCMSEEDKDVALQLMRLGDMSNISHGRTSASTLDDTFSGKADAASSTGATSEGESEDDDELPPSRRQKLDAEGNSQAINQTTEARFMLPGNGEASGDEAEYKLKMSKVKAPKPKSSIPKPITSKVSKPAPKTKKLPPTVVGPMSPPPQPVRKQSVSSATNPQPGEDEPDLSTKPRCQRCRKSKKGCDRQRPCGRCRDAGLTADQCISEDEGNGRKGRYGRHMGISIKKEDTPSLIQPTLLPAAPIIAPPAITAADKVKKRKR